MSRVLVPIEVLEGETISPGLTSLLETVDVTVLGYHVLPEQTPPDQARTQFEDRATDALEDLTAELRTAGGDADHRLVFTHNRNQTVDRIADEIGARATVITGVTGDIDRLLVSLTGTVDVDRILSFVEDVIGDREIGVTLFVAAKAETDATDRLDDAAARLREGGHTVETKHATGNPLDALLDAVAGHDAIVMGEQAPSLRSFLLGEEAERVAAASVGPVIVVRADEPTDT